MAGQIKYKLKNCESNFIFFCFVGHFQVSIQSVPSLNSLRDFFSLLFFFSFYFISHSLKSASLFSAQNPLPWLQKGPQNSTCAWWVLHSPSFHWCKPSGALLLLCPETELISLFAPVMDNFYTPDCHSHVAHYDSISPPPPPPRILKHF